MTSFDRGGIDRVHAHLVMNATGKPERVGSPDETAAFARDLSPEAWRTPVFRAPPELPDLDRG